MAVRERVGVPWLALVISCSWPLLIPFVAFAGIAGDVRTSSLPTPVMPCQFRIWENLDCASRLDAGRGRFDELHDEIRVICGINGRDADITVDNWLAANGDRFTPDIAESLIRTFDRFRTSYAPGKASTLLLGRQAFRRLSRSERIRLLREALRKGMVHLDSGYVLRDYQAVRDASLEGIQELEPYVGATRYIQLMDKQLADWHFRLRPGAASLSEGARLQLRNLAQMAPESVAGLLLRSESFRISVVWLRDDFCNPVLSPLCEDFKTLTSSWTAWLAVRPEVAALVPVGAGSPEWTLLQWVQHIAAQAPPIDCCRHAR